MECGILVLSCSEKSSFMVVVEASCHAVQSVLFILVLFSIDRVPLTWKVREFCWWQQKFCIFLSSVFLSSCIMIITFFIQSLIVDCLGKSAQLLYVQYIR